MILSESRRIHYTDNVIRTIPEFPREIKSLIYLVHTKKGNKGYVFARNNTGNGELLLMEGADKFKLLNPEKYILQYTESTIEYDDLLKTLYYKT